MHIHRYTEWYDPTGHVLFMIKTCKHTGCKKKKFLSIPSKMW